MKKMPGILIAFLALAAPMVTQAQVESIAGSLKIGAHIDAAYRWSGESKKNPVFGSDSWEIHWPGYDSVNMGDVYVELAGNIGDRVSFKILEGLVSDHVTTSFTSPGLPGSGPTLDIRNKPDLKPFTLEAYIDVKVIDQLKFRVGKQITPTLLANTGVHKSSVLHTANYPLIANGVVGFNQVLVGDAVGFSRLDMPASVTGAALILEFFGAEFSATMFDGWLLPDYLGAGDPFMYDFNKTKGGNFALGYSGELGPGKLCARGFYFEELSEVTPGLSKFRTRGWGLGATYTHASFFVAAEYANSTQSLDQVPAPNQNNWWGAYVTVAGRFNGIEPVYRFDYVDYSDWGNDQSTGIDSYDTETWHTIGVNYWLNDRAMLGLDYVIKVPETAKYAKYPTINELVIFVEVDTL